MKIGVIADSHDNLTAIRYAVNYLNALKLQWLVHCGDFIAPFAAREFMLFRGKIFAVYGNNDGEKKGLKNVLGEIDYGPRVFEIAGRKLLVAHSTGDIGVKCPEKRPDAVICGHTHLAAISTAYEQGLNGALEKDCLFLNPGECCGYLSGRQTLALLDLEDLKAEIVESGT
jgi:hypothetical protein